MTFNKLGIAPKVVDFTNNNMHATDMWFKKVTDILGKIPTLMATQSVIQSIASSVVTKVFFGIEVVDSMGCFDPVTSKFIPTVAGDYFVTTGVLFNMSAAPVAASGFTQSVAIEKNGVIVGNQNTDLPIGGNFHSTTTSCVVSMNGTTDFLEVYTLQNTGVARPTNNSTDTYFSAFLVRAL
jgi:hypothetical protein